MTTAVVILNWNGKKMLERFLPSVTACTTGDAEVIVADNGSTDDSLDFVRAHYPGLRIIELDKNYGFAGGYNRALEQVEADYFVLLNDDVEVTPGWVEPVIQQMQQHPEMAICQPKLLMYDQRDTFEYAGGAGGFIDKYGYPFCRGMTSLPTWRKSTSVGGPKTQATVLLFAHNQWSITWAAAPFQSPIPARHT